VSGNEGIRAELSVGCARCPDESGQRNEHADAPHSIPAGQPLARRSRNGRADIVFRRNDGMLAMYLLDGFQIIGAQLLGVIGAEWSLVGVGDLNGDGRSDMVFRRISDGQLSLYTMNGFQIVSAQLLGMVGTEWNAC
jgi:hypothetical protein